MDVETKAERIDLLKKQRQYYRYLTDHGDSRLTELNGKIAELTVERDRIALCISIAPDKISECDREIAQLSKEVKVDSISDGKINRLKKLVAELKGIQGDISKMSPEDAAKFSALMGSISI